MDRKQDYPDLSWASKLGSLRIHELLCLIPLSFDFPTWFCGHDFQPWFNLCLSPSISYDLCHLSRAFVSWPLFIMIFSCNLRKSSPFLLHFRSDSSFSSKTSSHSFWFGNFYPWDSYQLICCTASLYTKRLLSFIKSYIIPSLFVLF